MPFRADEVYAPDERRFVALDGAEVVGHLAIWPPAQHFGGQRVPMGGVAGVNLTDLQRNVKPPTSSLALSMDRRQAINRFIVELVQRPELPILDKGDRVEFLKDSPGR